MKFQSTLIFAALLTTGFFGPTAAAAAEPPARFWHSFSTNGNEAAGASRLYVFGGDSGYPEYKNLNDLWYYRADTHQWTLALTGKTKPSPRHGIGWSCGGGQCVAAGGGYVGALKETWIYAESPGVWTQLNCQRLTCPPARWYPAMAYDPVRLQHVLFGGEQATNVFLKDTYTFAGGKWTARTSASGPPPRFVAAAAFARAPVEMVVLYGGAYLKVVNNMGYFTARCDMWAWNGTTWLPIRMSVDPLDGEGPCLEYPNMAWDVRAGNLVVSGGYTLVDGGEIPNHQSWRFKFTDSTSGTWSKDESAFNSCAWRASPGAAMAVDVTQSSGAKVFFGGFQNFPQTVAVGNTTFCD